MGLSPGPFDSVDLIAKRADGRCDVRGRGRRHRTVRDVLGVEIRDRGRMEGIIAADEQGWDR